MDEKEEPKKEEQAPHEAVIPSKPVGATVPVVCPDQRRKDKLIGEEFAHTRKRLSRARVIPLIQFCVYVHSCSGHPETPDAAHIAWGSVGSDVQVTGGLQQAIFATEGLLAALKAKLQ